VLIGNIFKIIESNLNRIGNVTSSEKITILPKILRNSQPNLLGFSSKEKER
jgi:hypothetical protein